MLTVIKLGGVITTILLLIQGIDDKNPLLQKICNGADNKNCNAILSSNAANLSAYLSWSEVGFFYFSGTWLVILFESNHIALLQMLASFNLVSLPYTIYSIYFQWRIAKQWCTLCCIVQVILWSEFFTFLPYLTSGIKVPSGHEWGNFLMISFLPIIIWTLIKPLLSQPEQTYPLKQQL